MKDNGRWAQINPMDYELVAEQLDIISRVLQSTAISVPCSILESEAGFRLAQLLAATKEGAKG